LDNQMTRENTVKLLSAMLSAAPLHEGEGEPIGRNITFSPHDGETGNAVISPDYPDGPYWTLIAQGGDDRQNAVAAEICRRLNAAPPPSVEVSIVGVSLNGNQGEPPGMMTVTAHLSDGSEAVLIQDSGNVISHWKNTSDIARAAPPPSVEGFGSSSLKGEDTQPGTANNSSSNEGGV
jgi:hypothetical protein